MPKKKLKGAVINQNRNNASSYTKDGYLFDSREEVEFYVFLRDCLKLGLVKQFEYQPQAFELIPKAVERHKVPYKRKEGYKIVEKVLYPAHRYTLDFKFLPSPKMFEALPAFASAVRIGKDKWVYVDVKGAYNRFGGDRLFSLHRCMMYDKFAIHVNKVIPELFFKKLGAAPEELRWMQSRKVPTLKRAYIGLTSLDELKPKTKKGTTEAAPPLTMADEINIPFLRAAKTNR